MCVTTSDKSIVKYHGEYVVYPNNASKCLSETPVE
ncbi:DUF2913 family protein [Photobacterium japonica]